MRISPYAALGAVLALVLIMAKLPMVWPMEEAVACRNWLAITAEDAALALVVWALGTGADRLLSKKPGLQLGLRRFALGLALVAAIYSVANVGIFRALKQPLNSRILAMIEHVGDLGASLAEYWNWKIMCGMIAAPVFLWVASRSLQKVTSKGRFQRWFLGLAGAWMLVGTFFLSHTAADSWQRRAGRNAHREIVFSLVTDLFTNKRISVNGAFPPAYLADFQPAAQRRTEPVAEAPRNVILFVLESTSAQYLSLYGASYDTTPNLCAEARNAMVFDRAYAHVGYTFCSFMTLTYSVYPGLPWQYRPGGERPLPKGLAELLKAKGYRTAYFSSAKPTWGGMDTMANAAGIDEVFGPEELAPSAAQISWGCEDGPMTDGLLRWIGGLNGSPFFALAWTDQSHHPYTVSQDSPAVEFTDDGKPIDPAKARYLNAIRQADRQLGRLFAFLREHSLDQNTLVVVTGDHGEAFGDPHPIMGHGSGLFDENLRVPLLFWSPKLFPGGTRVEKPAGHIDINPTLANMLGIQPPADWQGCSLLSAGHPGRVYFMADRDGYQFGVLEGNRKGLLYVTGGYDRLYDLTADPLEQNDVTSASTEVASALQARIRAYIHAEEAYLKGQ